MINNSLSPSKGALSLSKGTVDDLDQIMELEAAGFPDPEQWSRTSWASQLTNGTLPVWLARDDQAQTIGVITLRLAGETADLDRIVVAPAVRRQGVARLLLDYAAAAATRTGVLEMILEVDTDNAAALALYESCGFADLAVRRDYYGPGRDARVMKLIMSPTMAGGER